MNDYGLYNQFTPKPRSNMEWIMVQSIDKVDSVAVQPNFKAWIMVQNEPIFALKTSDSMGLVTTEFYKFEKYIPNPAPEYITKDELMKMLSELKEDKNESINTKTTTESSGGTES